MKTIKSPEEIKQAVREKYDQISRSTSAKPGCCGSEQGEVAPEYSVMAEDYSHMDGYIREADQGLGCGLPTEFAMLKEGQTVVDLGSGAGNDCFIARQEVGAGGRVIGIDMSGPMVERARINAARLGYGNVEFHTGDIEALPLPDETADVVVSNCVLNLVPDKRKAFRETWRVLRRGGHFSVSDIVLAGELPVEVIRMAEAYAGCVAGAMQKQEYLDIIEKTGFENIRVQKERKIEIPDELLQNHLPDELLHKLRNSPAGIFSITVYAEKPV
jgi:arsenite methyltransferase